MTRLASNEIFSPSNKIHREAGRAKDLSVPQYHSNTQKFSFFLMEDTCYNSKEKFINSVTGHIPRILLKSHETRTLCDVRAEIFTFTADGTFQPALCD